MTARLRKLKLCSVCNSFFRPFTKQSKYCCRDCYIKARLSNGWVNDPLERKHGQGSVSRATHNTLTGKAKRKPMVNDKE